MIPINDLKTSNDAYHTAVEAVLRDVTLDKTEMKVKFAAAADDVFKAMARAREISDEMYDVRG